MSEPQRGLEYAAKTDNFLPTLGLRSAVQAMWIGVIPPVVGLLILGGYAISRFEALPFLGLFWLGIGGIMTVLAFAASVAGLVAIAGGRADPAGKRYFAIALVASLLSVPTAFICARVGASISTRSIKVTIDNKTDSALREVMYYHDDGSASIRDVYVQSSKSDDYDHFFLSVYKVTVFTFEDVYDVQLDHPQNADQDHPYLTIDITDDMLVDANRRPGVASTVRP
jgi:hypothetical protein